MYSSRRVKLRSRTGCDRCRTRHQKCDELKPQCSRCVIAGAVCTYEKQETRPHHIARKAAEVLLMPLASHTITFADHLFPLLSSSHGIFLSYYVREASTAISCNESIQHDTCAAVISVGSTFPSLLYASLLFSAMHKASRMHDESVYTKDQALQMQVLELRSATLSLLQSQVRQKVTSNHEAIIATALMLATCELRYDPETCAWRQHFECARQLLSQRRADDRPSDAALWRFICRRFTVMEFLVSLPMSWPRLPRRCLTHPAALPSLQSVGVIDSTMACCEDLLKVFMWIGVLEDIKYRSLKLPESEFQRLADHSQHIATNLVSIVHQMMARDRRNPPIVSDDVQGPLTHSHLKDYRVCNTIAQHVALICLYRYDLGLDRKHPSVANSVSSVIELAGATSKHVGLHPSICLTTALFVAGHEAEPEREKDIKKLLEIQYQVTKSRNTQKALDMLHRIWSAVPSLDRAGEKRDYAAGE